MNNPFNPGSGTPPPYLAGREIHLNTFEKMLDSIEDGHIENLILSGLRGTGKTVLIEEFNKLCVKKGFLPIKRLQFTKKYCDPYEFVIALTYDIRTVIESFSKINFIKNKFMGAISYFKPKQIGIPNIFYYEPAYSSSKIPFEDYLKEYLIKNWKVFENSKFKGAMLLYDEFHTIYDVPRKKWFTLSDFLGVLNEVQKEGCKYFVVFSGLPHLQINIKKAKSYSERMYKILEIGNLSEKEAKLAIYNPLKKSQYKFSNSLIDLITKETGQYPYFIQFYGKEIINNTNKKSISVEDFQKIRAIIVKQLDIDFFDARMESLSEDEKKVIFAMSLFKNSDIPTDFIKTRTSIQRTSLSKYLGRLEEKGLIYNYKRGIYRFSVPLLKDYLIRKSTK